MKRNFAIRKIRQMRAKTFLSITLAFLMILGAGCLYAQERETGGGVVPKAPSPSPGAHVEAFGVPLVPGIYLANLMLLYFSNPSEFAANMPAYRAALPQEVYRCLVENPDGCPYSDMAQYFASRPTRLEAAATRTRSGRTYARRTRDGKPWRHPNTDSLMRSTSHWGGRMRISSRGPWAWISIWS